MLKSALPCPALPCHAMPCDLLKEMLESENKMKKKHDKNRKKSPDSLAVLNASLSPRLISLFISFTHTVHPPHLIVQRHAVVR
jgi:hypothetical protein